MNHQDHQQKFLRRELTEAEAKKKGLVVSEKKLGGGGNKQAKQDMSARTVESENFKLTTVSLSLALQIQKARNAKGLSQKELAGKCQVPVGTIQQYENTNSGVVIESSVLQKISKALGVPLKKPPKQKKLAESSDKTLCEMLMED